MSDPRNSEEQRFQERMAAIREKTPQWQKVLHYMRHHNCITSAIAFDVLRITSLHRRLTDIERYTDYVIDRKRVDVPGRPHYYTYSLK